MTRFNNGEVDSPMAKRGCTPRSSSMTDRPARRAIIASSEPENPEPIMARSKSPLICLLNNQKINHEETKSTKIFLFFLRFLRFFVVDFPSFTRRQSLRHERPSNNVN